MGSWGTPSLPRTVSPEVLFSSGVYGGQFLGIKPDIFWFSTLIRTAGGTKLSPAPHETG